MLKVSTSENKCELTGCVGQNHPSLGDNSRNAAIGLFEVVSSGLLHLECRHYENTQKGDCTGSPSIDEASVPHTN